MEDSVHGDGLLNGYGLGTIELSEVRLPVLTCQDANKSEVCRVCELNIPLLYSTYPNKRCGLRIPPGFHVAPVQSVRVESPQETPTSNHSFLFD